MNDAMKIFYSSTGFSVTVLNFIIVFKIIYHRKKKQGVTMSPIFEFLMNLAFLPLILEITGSAFYAFIPKTITNWQLILDIFCKSYLVAALLWISIFIFYTITFIIDNIRQDKSKLKAKSKSKKYRYTVYLITTIICTIAGFLFSYNIPETTNLFIIRGPLYNIMNMEFFVSSAILYIILIIYKDKLPNLKLSPFAVIIVLYIILCVLEISIGYICNNLTSFFGLLIAVIYFTTESQDKMIIDNYTELKEKEKATNETKKNILINMSHGIRTPMHDIIGYTDILLNKKLSNEEYKENIENISNESKILKDTIENIIDVSKLNKNEVIVEQKEYDTKQLYLNVNSFINRNQTKENLRYTYNIDQTLPSKLYADSNKIYKILTKILMNAIDNTNYGEVKLDVKGETLDQDMIEITYTISNSGHTMTNEMFEMDYEEYMISHEHKNYIKLGVIIAKRYVELLGGTIEFENKPGNGTKYIIKIRQKIMSASPVGSIIE